MDKAAALADQSASSTVETNVDYQYTDYPRPDILRMIPPDGKVIGSFGCGWGAVEAELVKQGREVHGVDISAEAIATAAKRLTSARVINIGEVEVFEPLSLDGLILADVIEHMPQAWDALARMCKAVKPGGWVAISVPNMRSITVLQTFFFGGDWPELPQGIFDATHLQVLSHKRLKRWIQGAGLRVEKWFDLYDPNGPRRTRYSRIADLATLKLFHNWFMYELQVRCRK